MPVVYSRITFILRPVMSPILPHIKSHHKRHRHLRQEQPFIDPLYSYVFLLFLHFPLFSSHSLSAPILIYPEHNKYIVHPFGIDFGPFLRFPPAMIKRSVVPSLASPKLVHRPVPSIVLQRHTISYKLYHAISTPSIAISPHTRAADHAPHAQR